MLESIRPTAIQVAGQYNTKHYQKPSNVIVRNYSLIITGLSNLIHVISNGDNEAGYENGGRSAYGLCLYSNRHLEFFNKHC